MVATILKLYGMSVSTCTQKVVMALNEKNIPFEFININVLKKEQKTPEHVARHPFGKIPVLELEDGTLIFESLAIVRYIDAIRPTIGARLIPSSPKAAAHVDQWTYQSSYNFYPAAQQIIVETAIKPVARLPSDPAVLADGRKKLIPTLDIYEVLLGKQEFFAGDEFTLADLAHLPYFNVMMSTQSDLFDGRANLEAWFLRCTARESWGMVKAFVENAPKCH
ncbi:glutathione S-transferase [Blyttiomyces helicus]|uniref:glutathione transferase n=1 Tax=Blyttiomyces helicus TaxID=388810 RepID=A0A4P9VZS5_9FUNG|nr:glutathione S-transferase [Blyttiomyces helicus]|eukprot:RKO84852.1 glutathione S-transferase [Blyttiomyces helicus]